MNTLNEPIKLREPTEVTYATNFSSTSWSSSIEHDVEYIVNSKNHTVTFNTQKIPDAVFVSKEFRDFILAHEGIQSTPPFYRYIGDPRAVKLFEISQETFSEMLARARSNWLSIEDFAVITCQTWNAIAVVLATEISWGDNQKKKTRIEQQEIKLNDKDPAYYTKPIQAVIRKVELTRQALGITIQ